MKKPKFGVVLEVAQGATSANAARTNVLTTLDASASAFSRPTAMRL